MALGRKTGGDLRPAALEVGRELAVRPLRTVADVGAG